MAYLDNSTNNIIVDAVLTDTGREFLARNDGSFSIFKFAFGDDEVDYALIRKFGRPLGKEKIEKNTPVFEAQTNGAYAQKYRLVSVSDPTVVYLPAVSLSGKGLTGDVLTMGRTSNIKQSVTLSQVATGGGTVNFELEDRSYSVKMANQFLRLENITPDFIDNAGIANYVLQQDATVLAQGGTQVTLNFQVRSISDSVFSTYSRNNILTTVVTVTGFNSGAVKQFQVQIS
jgi:hypothetical protein